MGKNENEKLIWDLLYEKIGNPFGVAAIMGNLMAESSMNHLCLTGGYRSTYFMLVDKDRISREEFSHDGVAVGLVQWRFWSRKQGLFDYVKANNLKLGNAETQIKYLLEEMPKYKKVWKAVTTATDIFTVCDMVMLEYEKPGNTGDAAKQKRRNYAEGYYKKFIGDLTVEQKIDILWKEYKNGYGHSS